MVETGGRVKTLYGVARFYIKPKLGRVIIRKPGVDRKSEKVLKRNEAAAAAWSGPSGCPAISAGVDWPEFVRGLRKCAREKGLGTGIAKSREYRMRKWLERALSAIDSINMLRRRRLQLPLQLKVS
jgi:hypothetical protein